MKKNHFKRERIYQITAILLMIDQMIKLFISSKMNLFQEITIIPNFFSIHYVKNTGAAFSILQDNTIILTIISVIVIFFLDQYIRKEEKNLGKKDIISLGIIMGGIFGNLIDRIIHHGVIDYLSFQFSTYEFPVFNFADMCIVIGVGLLIADIILKRNKK